MTDNTINFDRTLAPGGDGQRGYSLNIGDQLGQYRIMRPLGRGGMGEVYLVEHTILTTRHALKLLPAELSSEPKFIQRFNDEARVMAKLRHPGIVSAINADISNGRHFLVMDFIGADGKEEPFDLEEAIALAPDGVLPPAIVAHLGGQIAAAVGAAHQSGVVHRDLKPANILLTSRALERAEAKVTDFGLARLLGEKWILSRIDTSMRMSMSLGDAPTMARQRQERSQSGSILGTYEYMSPEQREETEAGTRSDIYSLGVMLYRMVTGRRLMGIAKLPSKIVPGLAPGWDTLLAACLEESVKDRPGSMEQVVSKLLKLATPSSKVAASVGRHIVPETDEQEKVDLDIHKAQTTQAGEVQTVDLGGGVTLELVWCPAGSFVMGSPPSEGDRYNDEAQHQVRLTKGFWLGKYEVTQEQWQQVMGNNPSLFRGKNLPVENVSWDQCVKFCENLTDRERRTGRLPEGYAFRLPTEAEWEFAARGGTKSRGHIYSGGDNLSDVGWYNGNSGDKIHEVGTRSANELGLHDMSGNVWEWCADWYGAYSSENATDSIGPGSGVYRVNRGGSWGNDAAFCRVDNRDRFAPSRTSSNLGFRMSLAPPVQ